MSNIGKQHLIKFSKRWQTLLWLEVLLYTTGVFVFLIMIFPNILIAIIGGILTFALSAFIIKPWTIDLEVVSKYVDDHVEKLEYSSGLLLVSSTNLSGLAQLQQQKVAQELGKELENLKPKTNIIPALITSVLLICCGLIYFYVNSGYTNELHNNSNFKEDKILFTPVDSISDEIIAPKIETQQLTVTYPSYTGIPKLTTTNMDIKAVQGSSISWDLQFNMPVDSAFLESVGKNRDLKRSNGSYKGGIILENSGFYNFKFKDTLGGVYLSKLYAIEVVMDKAPEIEIEGIDQFTSFEVSEAKIVSFTTTIKDDFGIDKAYIVATVSKGTGESVKFREEKLFFEREISRGVKSSSLKKTIDLDQLKMEAGDELYFYVEALDLKQPNANIARSETHFAIIRDTANYGPGVEGSLGVDLMPDYFRSQRQLIIDTEKLISQRKGLATKEFNSTSNNLGFDQKSLRLKYGQFMGDESEMDAGVGVSEVNDSENHEDHDDEDPLAQYTHDHDGNNEHNLVVTDTHNHAEEEGEEQDPLAEYLHDHGDPEASTLFTDSLKSKLRQALDIMWDAELHLRLYEPEKSLPFQYKALALIQEIKNSARIYVHRIGYDPPPIKEDTRLTGKIDVINNFQKTEENELPQKFPAMREAVSRLETLKKGNENITEKDQVLFKEAGNELAEKAIAEPGRYLETLQLLNRLNLKSQQTILNYEKAQRDLLKALPKIAPEPGKKQNSLNEINQLLLKELDLNGR